MSNQSKLHSAKIDSGALAYTGIELPDFEPEGVDGWMIRSVEERGIGVFMFRQEANTSYPMHSAPGEWIGYVIKGSGTLKLEDPKTKAVNSTAYAAGDVFYFGPDTPHGWETGPQAGATLFVKVR